MQLVRYPFYLMGKLWALSFIFVGGCLLAAVVLPIVSLLPGERKKKAQFLIYCSFRFYIQVIQLVGLIKLEVEDAHKFSKCHGKMVIANHPSLLDVVILMSLIPKAQCIIKHQLWNHLLLGGLMRQAGFIRNDLEPGELIASCKSSLEEGCGLIIFPEGTRTIPGSVPHFQRGFANVATLTEVPIQLVVIDCSSPFLFKGEPWWHVPPQKPLFRVTFGEYLDAKEYCLYGQRSINARKLVKSLELYYAAVVRNKQSGIRTQAADH